MLNHSFLFITFKTYWNRIDPFKRLRLNKGSKEILSCKEFQAILELERCQADRIGYEFSLVVFDVGNTGDGASLAEHLTHILKNRRRITDKIGWFSESHLGVILSGTSANGALKFAEEIFRKSTLGAEQLTYRVYTYPSTWLPGRKIRSDQRRATGGSLDSAARPLFFAGSDDLDAKVTAAVAPGASYRALQEMVEDLEPLFLHPMPVWKRSVDIICSVFGLIFLSPLFVAVAIMIRIISPGPVLFRQERVGYLGRPFTVLKFRTMMTDADESAHRQHVNHLIQSNRSLTKLDSYNDPRIIPFGKFLRRFGIDELPQLINVLRGEMSIVGPRPDVAYSVQQYQPWNTRRLDTVSGLTGLWQVSGKNDTTFKDMIRLDIAYARHKSFWFDLKIIALTIPSILLRARKQNLTLKMVNFANRLTMTACKAMVGILTDRIRI